jgi:ferredoxin
MKVKKTMPNQQLTIYYFSGTGNSKNVARWMSSAALANNCITETINIASVDRLKISKPDKESLIVFVSPIHGFNYPPVMLHFLARFPKGKNKVVLMNTRAGMSIGKLVTPGLTGIAFILSWLILKLKGYSIVGTLPVDLPSNWISLHPSLKARSIQFLHERNKARVLAFAEKILSGQRSFNYPHEFLINLIISPVSIGYYFVGRFLFAKSFYASSACDHCDLCINSCPVKAIIKVDNRPYWTFNCESCMNCISHCPKRAIETAHGFVIGYMFFSSAITGFFINYINLYLFTIGNEAIRYIFETFLFLFFMGIFYYLIHWLMRYTFFERIMVFTSLTWYKFWGKRYRALKDF